jgi:putative aldouronate transport system substrate-binding protein
MKKITLLIAVCAVSALIATVVSCGKQQQQQQASDGPITISVVATHWAPYPIPAEDSVIFKALENNLGVTFAFDWRQATDYGTQIAVLLASGNLPDVMNPGSMSGTINLKDEGAIIELDALLERHGQNVLKAVGPDRMASWRQVDGHIYTITGIVDLEGAYSWMIRKDWLDKLGLSEPSTWNEWLAVWRAFRDNDVRGDRTSVIPLAFDQGGQRVAAALMWAFGIQSTPDGQFCVYNGTYMPVYEHPRYADFLRTAADLFREGILDQEFSSRVQNDLFIIMDSGLCASTMTWAERASLSTTTNRGAGDQAAYWKSVAPPIGPFGDQYIQPRDWRNTSLSITTAAEKAGKAERIMQVFDYLYSDKGIELYSYGVAGQTFDYVAGKPVLRQELLNESFVSYRSAGLQYGPFVGIWTEDAYMQCLNRGLSYDQLAIQVQSFYDGLFTVNKGHYYDLPETLASEAYLRYNAELITNGVCVLRDRTIAGQITVDEFTRQYQALKSRGFQQIIDQGAAAYAEKSSR